MNEKTAMNYDSSVNKVTGYGLNDWRYIPGRGFALIFVSTCRLSVGPPNVLSKMFLGRGADHTYLVTELRLSAAVEYLLSPTGAFMVQHWNN
jgi:hypothetical protein